MADKEDNISDNSDDNVSNLSELSGDSQLEDIPEVDFNEYQTVIPEGQVLTSDFMDMIKQKHDPDRYKLGTSYAIIKRYLIDNKRIITGGMAIDTALRTKDSKLYEIEKIDYDFITPDFHNDAYKIALAISQVPQLSEVHVINAIHTSTMRVRFNYTYVADSTYMHQQAYDLVPTLEYNGLRVVHPCYQVLDQHLALSHPYSNVPIENVLFKRFRHDITRYELLSKYFDLGDELIAISKKKNKYITDEKLTVVKKHTAELDLSKFKNQCLSGYMAYAYWMNQEDPDNYKFDIKGDTLHYTTETPLVTILSDDYGKVITNGNGIRYYNGLNDKLEPRAVDGDLEVLDNNGNMTSAHKLGDKDIYVAGIQHTMLYLGMKAIFYNDPLAAEAYSNLSKIFLTGITTKNTKYVYDLNTYGSSNRSENETLLIEKQCGIMNAKRVVSGVPAHYYPKNSPKFPTFNLASAKIYDFDGQPTDKLEKYKAPEVCEDIIR